MTITNILSSIDRTNTYPVSKTLNAEHNCGTFCLVLGSKWTEQMLSELPTINISFWVDSDTRIASLDIDMRTVNDNTIKVSPASPYAIPIYDLPSEFIVKVTPLFDKFAISAHNYQIENGSIEKFNTSSTGVVDTDMSDYSSELWTTETQTFTISIDFNDANIVSGGGSGGGGGGGTVDVDTQISPVSTNPVENKAIYAFVNSSVSTNTAYFIGTFNSVQALEAYSGTVSNNDYAFVISTDSSGNTIYNRYKYNGETETWNFEYALNNSSFTAAEWETIQSGLTAQDKTTYSNHVASVLNPHNVTKSQVGLGNVDNTSDANKPISTATQTALNAKQDTVTFDGTYDASTNKAATVSTVTNAINDLDVSSVGGSGKYISAISETNGKISPTVETMDTVPTSGSTKAVTSGGVQAPLAEVINSGAKNVLKTYNVPSTTTGNVTYSVSSGVVTVSISGTQSTAKVLLYAMDSDVGSTTANSRNTIPKGTYILKTTGNGKVKLRAIEHNGATTNLLAETTGADAEFTYTGAMPYVTFTLSVSSNTSLSEPLTFIPMCCLKSLYAVDNTPELYALSNPELTSKMTVDEAALTDLVDSGTKSLAVPFITSSIEGIAITISDDGAYTFVCTNVSENKIIRVADIRNQPRGEYVLSGCTGGSSTTFMLGLYNASSSAVVYQHTDPSVSYTGDISGFSIRVQIIGGYTGTFTVRPMICSAVEWNISQSYVPYQAGLVDIYQTTTKLSPISDHGYDLDNLPVGRFQVESSTYAARIDNSPIAGTGYDVICKYLGNSAYKVQIAYCNTAADSFLTIFIRHYRGTGSGSVVGWSPWEKFKAVGGSLSLSAATALAPNDGETVDLNTIITPDLYRVSSSTYASRITNSPITDFGYNLAVAQIGGVGYIRQEIVPANAPADIYVRYYNGTTWSSWVKMLSQNDAVMAELVNNGAKNRVKIGFASIPATSSEPSVTNNGDGTITLNGTRTATGWKMGVNDVSNGGPNSYDTRDTLDFGTYYVSGSMQGSAYIQVIAHDGVTGKTLYDSSSEGQFTYSATDKTTYPYICYRLFYKGGISFNNTVLSPMICTAADWAISQTYQPYCPPLPDIFKWDEYECLYTSSTSVIAKLNTTTSSVKVRINKALRRVVIVYKIVFIADFVTGTDNAFGFGSVTSIANYASYYPFELVRNFHILSDYTMVITKGTANALISISPISGTVTSGTTLSGQFEYTY